MAQKAPHRRAADTGLSLITVRRALEEASDRYNGGQTEPGSVWQRLQQDPETTCYDSQETTSCCSWAAYLDLNMCVYIL